MTMVAQENSTPGHLSQSFLTVEELTRLAASKSRLEVESYREDKQELKSGVVGCYHLSQELIRVLEKSGFSWSPGTRQYTKDLMYLCGNSVQSIKSDYECDCWSWKNGEENRLLDIYFKLTVNETAGGGEAVPRIWGNCLGSAAHQPTINRLAIALAKYLPDSSHKLLKQLGTYSCPVIPWITMGLGGLKSVASLFQEVNGKDEALSWLANYSVCPLDPNPIEAGNKYFVARQKQDELIKQWQIQLRELRDKLD